MSGLWKALIDLFFPPLCLSCQEPYFQRLFCKNCWQELSLPDPVERCRHCFEFEEGEVCQRCLNQPELIFPRAQLFDPSPSTFILKMKMGESGIDSAIASMAYIFWQRLEWEVPDLIVEVPNEEGIVQHPFFIQTFSKLVGSPYQKLLKRGHRQFLVPELKLKTKWVKPNRSYLLVDFGSKTSWLKEASLQIAETIPESVSIFSLFPNLSDRF